MKTKQNYKKSSCWTTKQEATADKIKLKLKCWSADFYIIYS